MAISIRQGAASDRAEVLAFLRENHSERVARLERIEHPLDHPALLAERDGRLAGVLTYVVADDQCEILTLHAAERWHGVGSALIAEVERLATERDCTRLWVLTTNDNLDAMRFYQRRGFRLAQLKAGAVDRARATLKPEIPTRGLHGIPIRDEVVLEKLLRND
jgi:GNAT superfamily N-acetyltransferase